MKKTPQRIAIIKFLQENKTHPSAIEIYKAVSKKFPTMSLATVYNTLEVLKEKGLIKELYLDPTMKRFDGDTSPHQHMICIKCGLIKDIKNDFAIEIPEEIKKEFEILESRIEFYGLCQKCKKRRKKK